jgi:hypothetical protein
MFILDDFNDILKENTEKDMKKYKKIIEIYDEMNKKLQKMTEKIQNTIQYLDIYKIKSMNFSKEESISLSLLHAFGNNLVRKMNNTKYYLPIKYPIKGNVMYLKKNKTNVESIYLHNYLLYITTKLYDENDIANTEISIIHYVNPELLKYISYQFPIQKYIKKIKEYSETEYVNLFDYHISNFYYQTLFKIINEIKNIIQSNPNAFMIFRKINEKLICKLQNDSIKYIQHGGGKYKISYLKK